MTRNKMDRRGSGPLWFVILVLVVFGLYSVTIAAVDGRRLRHVRPGVADLPA